MLFKDKRGVMGLDTGKAFLVALLSMIVIGVVFMVVLNALGDTTIVSGDTDTANIITNATSAASDFFSNTGTWLSLLSIVILILIIVVVIVVVNRTGGRTAV